MELNYQRCPEDNAKIISASIHMTHQNEQVVLGLAEIATSLQMKGSVYATTLAIKGGVPDDFLSRCAASLASQMGGDIHALCPVIQILCECFALMASGKAVLDKDGQVSIYPSKECPKWIRGYFDKKMEGN